MILIVEDNPAPASGVGCAGGRLSLELAGSAVEARAVLARAMPDLILMDIQLAGGSTAHVQTS